LAKEGKAKLFLSRFPLSETESLSEVLEVIAGYKLGGNRKGNFLKPWHVAKASPFSKKFN